MRYNIVNNSQREELIKLVYGDDPITIREACVQLKIKLTTAKTILKIYRSEGRIHKSPFRAPRRPVSVNRKKTPSIVEVQSCQEEVKEAKPEPAMGRFT